LISNSEKLQPRDLMSVVARDLFLVRARTDIFGRAFIKYFFYKTRENIE